MRKILITIYTCFLVISGVAQETISIVPYPKQIKLTSGYFNIFDGLKVTYANKDLVDVANLLVNDLYVLYGISAKSTSRKGDIILNINKLLEQEEYTIELTKDKIIVAGGSYNAVCMGVTSVLQLLQQNDDGLKLPICKIKDKPVSEYRGLSLDVARQWHSIETVKQAVELCRWYKVRYMQIHISDDQSFTFPSTAYPKIASKDRQYTLDELRDLVEFAKQRGVIIIPEFDAPGHTGEMRKNMPELFGKSDLGVIDMTSEKVYEAMEIIMKEMMDVFYTSPYFHIGADEAWLGNFEKTENSKAYVEKMGFDNAHDIYLNFIVRMHNIVKKYGKKTLVWESFQGKGSNKVVIPNDLLVMAWETAYQRPESLLKNGYQIINASWKPGYITPGLRWSPEYIYNWNMRRWENHWNVTPSYHKPIQLDKDIPVFGGQMCSWEMSELQQIESIHQRVPAISEVFWNGDAKKEYSDYYKRYQTTDEKYKRLIFPVSIQKEGFTEPNYEGLYLNKENRFADKASITLNSLLPDTKITYTTDGKVPDINSAECPKTFSLENDMEAKFAIFNKDGKRIGYKIVKYELNAINPVVKGNMLALRDTNIYRHVVEFINEVELSFDELKKGCEIRYTLDNSNPVLSSELYTSSIKIRESKYLKVRCFYKGKPYGMSYECKFTRKDFKKSLVTDQKVSCSSSNDGYEAENAVDGFVDINNFWDASPYPQWLMCELSEVKEVKEFQLFTYWDNDRYYQYTIDVSADGKEWTTVVDVSDNKIVATEAGYKHQISPVKTKYIRINMLKNSVNKGVHILEFRAY